MYKSVKYSILVEEPSTSPLKRTCLLLLPVIFPAVLFGARGVSGSGKAGIIDILLEKAEGTYFPDSSIFYARQALWQSRRYKLFSYSPQAFYMIGKGYIARAEYDSAEQALRQGVIAADSIGDRISKGLCILESGKVRQLTHRNDDAFRLFIAAYNMFDAAGSRENLVRADVMLAEYYRSLGKYDDAKAYIKDAFNKSKGIQLDQQLAILMNNRAAAIKSETGDRDSALYYSNIALTTSIATGNLHYKAISLNEIGFILENKKQFHKAEQYYSEAQEIWKRTGHKRYWANAVSNRARLLIRMNNRTGSNQLLFELVNEIKDKGWHGTIASVYGMIADNYYQLGDYRSAADYRNLQRINSEVDARTEHLKEVEDIKARYETEKNRALLKEKEREIEQANMRMGVQEKETRALLLGSVLLVFALGVVIYFYRHRSRLNRELTLKNLQIEDVNQELSASLAQRETLMKEVHHRVKNNLQIISSMLHLQASSITNEELKALLRESDNRILLMAYLHERLYRQNDLERLNAREFIESITENIVQSYSPLTSSISLVSEIEEIPLKMDKAVATGIIVNELVTNSIKYAFPNGHAGKEIKVRLFMNGSTMNLHVTDNGVGLPLNFDVEESPSFGLKLVSIMVDQAEGRMNMQSEGGAKFHIEL